MEAATVRPHPPAGAPEMIFRWRGTKQPLLPKLIALAFGVVALAFLLTLRIRVAAPEKTTARKASVIFLRDDAEGRALSLRAREGGPFPSRFKPSQWEGMAEMETAAMDAVRFLPQPYAPAASRLPEENQLRPLELAAKGVSFFPPRLPSAADAPDSAHLKLAPVLHPLAGITREALPGDLPPFDAAVDSAMSAASWRFLMRLTPTGGVTECVSLEKGGEAGAPELEKWLRRLQFKPEPAKPARWIAVGVGFTNQPARGTDAR